MISFKVCFCATITFPIFNTQNEFEEAYNKKREYGIYND